uniref:Uncharacterized protein n=1 Tax=Magallana gigas TaxID=29159 RepID=K1PBC6_MAGGI
MTTQKKRRGSAVLTQKKRHESAMNAATALWGRCVNAAKWKATCSNAVDAQ